MNKRFHKYSDQELVTKKRDPNNPPWGVDSYLILIGFSFAAFGEPSQTMVAGFNNCLEALNFCYDILLEIECYCNEAEFRKKCNDIETAIEEIKKSQSDVDTNLAIANFDFDELSFDVICAGYWDDVVLKIIFEMKQSFECYDPGFYMDPDEDEYVQEELFVNEKCKVCEELLKYNNVREKRFVDTFNNICKSYNDFFDPDK